MKKILLALCLLVIAVPAFAQETTNTETPQRPGKIQDIRAQEAREQMRAGLKEDRRDERKEITEQRKAIVNERETIKKEFKGELDTLRSETRAEFNAASTPLEKKAVLEEAKLEKDALKQRAQDARKEFTGKVKGLFTERVSVGIRIFETHILRAETMRNRIEEGSEKLQAKNIDTSSVQTHLDLASTHIALVEASVEEVKVALASATSAESDEAVKALYEEAKANFTEGREGLKSAFTELRLAVSEFRELVKTNKPEEQAEEPIAE